MIYEENVERIQSFYSSDLYINHLYGDFRTIKQVIEALYVDPDSEDIYIQSKVSEIEQKFKKKRIDLKFSADGICGWKILYDVYSEDGNDNWIKMYEIIRGSIYGEIFFPSQIDQSNKITINTERNFILGDRIDMFLYDFKTKIEKPNIQSKLQYKNSYSQKFVNYYKENGFAAYIKDFELFDFTDKRYQILNVATRELLTENDYNKYFWSNRLSVKMKKVKQLDYLNGLVEICSKNPKVVSN